MQSRGIYFYIEDLSGYRSRGRCRDLCGRQISKGISWFMFWGVWRLEGGERSVKSLRDSLEGGFKKKVGYYGMESVSDLE